MITYFSYFCACLLFSPLLLHIAYRSCKTDYHTNDNNSNVTKHNRHNKSNQKKKKKKKKKEKNKEAKERMRRRTTTGTSRTRPRLQAWPQNQKDGRGTFPIPDIFRTSETISHSWRTEVTIAFQLSDARANEWSKMLGIWSRMGHEGANWDPEK